MSSEGNCQIAGNAPAPDAALTPAAPPMPLRHWLWRSYVRAAIIPLIIVELGFLAIYWASNTIVHAENVATLSKVSHSYLFDMAKREAVAISRELAGYSDNAAMFARQVGRALDTAPPASAEERARYVHDPDGSWYTVRDNGTTAGFFSNVHKPGERELRDMLRLAAVDPLMIDLQRSSPGVVSVYFNSNHSYNRIYPYFDAATQYPRGMDIPSYNFYYLADARHNPRRVPVWTNAYVDPAGHGWMVSAIAPVWKGNTLQGVVGIDIGLQAVIDRLMKLDLPWDGYALLVDREGRIIAMPPAGESDFRLKELTRHTYDSTIQQDSFKPDAFNLARRPDTKALAAAMARQPDGSAVLDFDGPHEASFATVPGLGWRLVVIAPRSRINAEADALERRLRLVSFAMMGGLLLFYIGFFVVLWRRARDMSGRVARPLQQISGLMERIGSGAWRQSFDGAQVAELDALGTRLVAMGSQLGDAHDQIVRQERIVRTALERQTRVNEQQARLVQIMSHELRTPLSLVDSGAQIIDRKAGQLDADQLRQRSARIRGAVRRAAELLDKLVDSLSRESRKPTLTQLDLAALTRERAQAVLPAARLLLDADGPAMAFSDPAALGSAIDAVLDNAARYASPDGPVAVRVLAADREVMVEVEDAGPLPPPEHLAAMGELFWRGENATGVAGAGVSLNLAARQLAECGGRLEIGAGASGVRVRISVPAATNALAEPADRGDKTA